MITVEEALSRIENETLPLPSEEVQFFRLLGRILKEDILSPIDMPGFNQSAMDGYAFSFDENVIEYEVVGEVQAGSSGNPKLRKGQGVRIFTGARVPDDADIVVQQEWIERNGDHVKITQSVQSGMNIRPQGEQIRKGETALKKGYKVSPAGVGFLSGIGVTHASVFRKPVITLVTTGNELVQPGRTLKSGQIYESNSYMLRSALQDYGFDIDSKITVADNFEETYQQIKQAIYNSDVVIVTGGISVGDYDYVKKALEESGVTEVFYKIQQKPGKPMYMGKRGGKLIFALPGNPAAALTCFYMYILPSLNKMIGKDFKGLQQLKLPISHDFQIKGNRSLYLKATRNGDEVQVSASQSSAMLDTFATADGLIYLPASLDAVKKGDEVVFYPLK